MQSGSCATQTRSAARGREPRVRQAAPAARIGATAAACLRGLPEQTLLDASASYQPLFISGGPELPVPAGAGGGVAAATPGCRCSSAPTTTRAARSPRGSPGFTQQQAEALITQEFGSSAPTPSWPGIRGAPIPSPYTAAYMIGDIWTDSGFISGIGGCPDAEPGRREFAATTRDVLLPVRRPATPPGSTTTTPATSGAPGHAMELAYLWPSFDNGFPLADQLTPGSARAVRRLHLAGSRRSGPPPSPRSRSRAWWSECRSTSVPMKTPRSRLRMTANHSVEASRRALDAVPRARRQPVARRRRPRR